MCISSLATVFVNPVNHGVITSVDKVEKIGGDPVPIPVRLGRCWSVGFILWFKMEKSDPIGNSLRNQVFKLFMLGLNYEEICTILVIIV